jgi:hypothetical protein
MRAAPSSQHPPLAPAETAVQLQVFAQASRFRRGLRRCLWRANFPRQPGRAADKTLDLGPRSQRDCAARADAFLVLGRTAFAGVPVAVQVAVAWRPAPSGAGAAFGPAVANGTRRASRQAVTSGPPGAGDTLVQASGGPLDEIVTLFTRSAYLRVLWCAECEAPAVAGPANQLVRS